MLVKPDETNTNFVYCRRWRMFKSRDKLQATRFLSFLSENKNKTQQNITRDAQPKDFHQSFNMAGFGISFNKTLGQTWDQFVI